MAILAGERFTESVNELTGYRVVSPGFEIPIEEVASGAADAEA
jgi:hypothetical protein